MFSNNHSAQWRRKAEFAAFLTGVVVAFTILLPIPARAQTETVLYSFNYPTFTFTGCPPGSYNVYPHTGPLFYKGDLYSTTPEGGSGIKSIPGTADGTVFKLTAPTADGKPWNKKTLHNFVADGPDGTFPCSHLIEKDGVLYGSTIGGGADHAGTVFSLTPPGKGQTAWTETILYDFTGQVDGAQPFDALAMDSNGSLYGVTMSGINGPGVFEISPNGSGSYYEGTLATNSLGWVYNGGLLLDESPFTLFGTTQDGGKGYGNVFALTLTGDGWMMNDLYDFTGSADGAYPNGGLKGAAGDLFGTTQGGGNGIGYSGDGVLFELRQEIAGSPYTLIVQHTFSGNSADGATPDAALHQDANGTLWGTTTVGGADNLGTIFELYPDRIIVHDWHYKLVYSFAGGTSDGANPEGVLTEDTKGNLYGTTNAGGLANDGTVFQLTP
jgi:uncharacterized repeat protein (TIGR03803 family)